MANVLITEVALWASSARELLPSFVFFAVMAALQFPVIWLQRHGVPRWVALSLAVATWMRVLGLLGLFDGFRVTDLVAVAAFGAFPLAVMTRYGNARRRSASPIGQQRA